MADYFTHFAFQLRFETPEVAAQALTDFEAMAVTIEMGDQHLGVTAARWQDAPNDLFFSDDGGSPDLDELAGVILALGQKHGLKGRFGFQFSDSCSKARPDAFGGGAVAVDFDESATATMHTAMMVKRLVRDSDPEDWSQPDLDHLALQPADAA